MRLRETDGKAIQKDNAPLGLEQENQVKRNKYGETKDCKDPSNENGRTDFLGIS
jgi:hypothetical protein